MLYATFTNILKEFNCRNLFPSNRHKLPFLLLDRDSSPANLEFLLNINNDKHKQITHVDTQSEIALQQASNVVEQDIYFSTSFMKAKSNLVSLKI